MTFWNDPALEPKRQYRFRFIVSGQNNNLQEYLIKKVQRPAYETSESEHKYLNHTFYFPGKVAFSELTFTIVDAVTPNAAQALLRMIKESGYVLPRGSVSGIQDAQTVSKLKATEALGSPVIQVINADNEIVEEWTLRNCWIKNVNFGEFDYDGEDLMNIEVTLRFDFPEISIKGEIDGTDAENLLLPN